MKLTRKDFGKFVKVVGIDTAQDIYMDEEQIESYNVDNNKEAISENTKFVNLFDIFHFLKCGYYFGVIPFKPVALATKPETFQQHRNREAGNFCIDFHTNILQKIVCFIIYMGAFIWSVMKLTNSFPVGGMYVSPSRILAVFSCIFQTTYVLSFAYKFGLKSDHVKCLLNCEATITKGRAWKTNLRLVIFPILPFFFTSFSTYIQFRAYLPNISKNCQEETNTNYLKSFFTGFINCETIQTCRYICSFLLIWCAELIYNNFQTFLLVLALNGKENSNVFADEIEAKMKSRTSEECLKFSQLLKQIEHCRKYFDAINKVASIFFLYFLCQLIPWTGYRLLGSMPNMKVIFRFQSGNKIAQNHDDDDDDFAVKAYNWFVLAYYSIITYYAADAKRNVQKFRDNLTLLIVKREAKVSASYIDGQYNFQSSFQRPYPSSFALCKYVEQTLKDSCFYGGPFFHFSYSFIGTIIGIITTLTLFELQFGQKEHSRFLNS